MRMISTVDIIDIQVGIGYQTLQINIKYQYSVPTRYQMSSLDINNPVGMQIGYKHWVSSLNINFGYQHWISILGISKGYQHLIRDLAINIMNIGIILELGINIQYQHQIPVPHACRPAGEKTDMETGITFIWTTSSNIWCRPDLRFIQICGNNYNHIRYYQLIKLL